MNVLTVPMNECCQPYTINIRVGVLTVPDYELTVPEFSVTNRALPVVTNRALPQGWNQPTRAFQNLSLERQN